MNPSKSTDARLGVDGGAEVLMTVWPPTTTTSHAFVLSAVLTKVRAGSGRVSCWADAEQSLIFHAMPPTDLSDPSLTRWPQVVPTLTTSAVMDPPSLPEQIKLFVKGHSQIYVLTWILDPQTLI
jgi:hypothetical protein